MAVLVLLAGRPRQLLTRGEIIGAVWERHVSADQLLTRAISELRRALHDDRNDLNYIETVPKRGYRLLCDVLPVERAADGIKDQRTPGAPRRSLLAAAVAIPLLLAAYVGFIDSGRDRTAAVPPTASSPESSWSFAEATPSIAVLPFVNMSADPANEYLAEGIAEEIRTLLAGLPGVRVIGRTSSSAFRNGDQDLRAIGNTLGVGTVLEGSVRRSGDELRITAQLINVADASRIWSETYHRKLTDVFEVQDDVAAAIIDALNLHITTYPSRGRPTVVPEAYALYLNARRASNAQDAKTAESYILRAIEIDPDYAEAYELLAHVYWTMEDRERTRDAAAAALRNDPDRGLARALFIEASTEEYSLADVIDAGVAAARSYPSDPATLRTLSWNLAISGYLREALAVSERLVAVEPLSQIAHLRLAAVSRAVGKKDASHAALKVAYGLGPSDELLLDWYFGQQSYLAGEQEAAIRYFESAVEKVSTLETGWIRQLLLAASDPATGLANLDRMIPAVLDAMPVDEAMRWQDHIERLYLLFGYVDRFLDITLDRYTEQGMWSRGVFYVWSGTTYRDLGFTASPKYLVLAERMELIDVWERRGPPDFCNKIDNRWVCH